MISRTRIRPYILTSVLVSFGTTLPAATLQLLGSPSSDFFSYGLALANTGPVAGYAASFEESTPLLWAKSGSGYAAPLALPLISGSLGGEVRWISADASLAAGYVLLPNADSSANFAPVLWTRGSAGSYTGALLPRLAGSLAEGVVVAGAANGSRLAGGDGATETATVWRGGAASSYYAQALPLPAGASGPSFVTASSADGTRLAGRFTTGLGAQQALVWTEAAGAYSPRALQLPAGAVDTFAEGLSADGTLAVGASDQSGVVNATRWDAATGQATLLETLPGADTTALNVSADKAWIGGRATDLATAAQTAVLWNAQGKVFTLASLAADVDFGGFVPGDVSAITVVSPGVYTVAGTGATLGTGQTLAFVIENLALGASSTPTTPTSPTTPAPGTTTPTTPTAPTTTTPTSPTTTTPTAPTTTTPGTDTASTTTSSFDPSASDSRTLVGDAFSAIFDPARATQSRFSTDQAALRPLRAAFPGTSRDSLSFDGTRMLPGARSQDLFAPGVAQDMGFVGVVRVPSAGGVGKAILFTVNRSDTEPAIALGYDYGQSRFYAVFSQAFNGAPSEIAGAASPRGASYVVRLQKTGGVVSLRVDGVLVAETGAARPAILSSGQGGLLGLGGIRPLNPQFVGQLGRFHLRVGALSNTEAGALESDLRSAWVTGGATTTPTTPTTPPTTTPTAPTTSTPTPPTTTAPDASTLAGVFDPAASASRTIIGNAYAAIVDPTRSTWCFATDQSGLRPLRAAFPGTSLDSLSFDGARMLPGPRSSDLFTPGVTQNMGVVAAVRIPAVGGSGRAHILTVNLTDTEPAVAIGYDYSAGRFFAAYTAAFNGAPGVISGGSAPRGASYVVSLQKTGGTVRLRVNGVVVAETASARPAILAGGQNGNLGLGGIRALNPQFVGQVGKFHLRNTTLSDSEAIAIEAGVRAWFTP